jgi:hypothetical protein
MIEQSLTTQKIVNEQVTEWLRIDKTTTLLQEEVYRKKELKSIGD